MMLFIKNILKMEIKKKTWNHKTRQTKKHQQIKKQKVAPENVGQKAAPENVGQKAAPENNLNSIRRRY
jgi:hypothetical protein